ncbi:hypothetical protein FG386_001292 [Cryptosporidium ryanae]|uniref:uncharacterized protein n=1 Tax=Cryptosporidium ryanae TaxID=515981 RepID=UPI00351A0EA0|nr:hypothetical protein FG386_001292 [Cryptosporidium ryanae]
MRFSYIYDVLDNILLLKINKTVAYLHEKVSANNRCKEKQEVRGANNLKTFRSRDIPFGYKEYSIKDDSIRLAKVISEREEEIGSGGFSALDMYKSILKAFKTEYTSFVLLVLFMLSFEAFVKYRGILYFRLLIGESSDKKSLKAILPGLLMFILKAVLLISETHIKYYIQRVRARVMGAINGVSLLRLYESDLRIPMGENNIGEAKNGDEGASSSSIPKSNISRYQNVISVDSDFSESAVSYSVRMFIFPLKLITSFAVAAVTFDDRALKLLVIILSSLFMLAVSSLFISTLFKRPFIAHREKRIAESTSIIENSISLILTQDHIISSYHDLLSGTRRDEMYYGSFRKYFFTLEEIISRSMGFICYGIITVYVWYNHFDVLQSIEMIVNAAWLVPSFYSPLQEVCYLIYYVSEGTNALSRLAKLIHTTKTKRNRFSSNEQNFENYANCPRNFTMKNSVVIRKEDLISIDLNETFGKSVLPRNITLNYGIPVIISSNDMSYSHVLTDLLRTVIFGTNDENGVRVSLLGSKMGNDKASSFLYSSADLVDGFNKKISVFGEIMNPVCYVPAEAWITDRMSLFDIILNGRKFDLDHWNRVIDVCDLEKDFSSWGISDYESAKSTVFSQVQFSRGQKIRLALSRAIYGICQKGLSCENEMPSIVLLDSIFLNLDPPICCSIFSKLFNNVDGVLMNTFSVVVLSTHMLTFLPKNLQECSIYIVPHGNNSNDDLKSPKDATNGHNNNNHCHKLYRGSNTSASINSIVNDYCFESDLSRDLWEMSTDEDEIFSLGAGGDNHKSEDIYICNNSCGEGFNSTSSNDNWACVKRYNRIKYVKENKHCSETRVANSDSNVNLKENDSNVEKCECLASNVHERTQNLNKMIEEKLGENIELLPKNGNICPEDKYSTCFYYILKAANKYKYPKNWEGLSKIKESSIGIMIYLSFLLLPQLLLVFGEKFLLSNLASNSAMYNAYNKSLFLTGADFWYFTYFICVVLAVAIVIINGYLEVSIGLRAARNIHNSFLLGYISSKLSSCIRSLPVSFVLNRLSLDQLTIDYCTTKRVGQFTTAINRLMGAVYLSLLASEYPLIYLVLFSLFIYMLYKLVLRYFITSCRLLHNSYISEVSPLVDIVRNICDGKESLKPQKLDGFYIQNGYEQLQEVMRPILIQSSLETWLKLRLQVGILIPTTFLNMISSYFSDRNSKILIALIIATTYSSLSRIDEVVRYWMRLERELVSVERLRKYIQLIKNDYFIKKSSENVQIDYSNCKCNIDNEFASSSVLSLPTASCGTHYCYFKNNIVLDSVYGFHFAMTSENSNFQIDRSELSGTILKRICCLRNISAIANKGDIIGIVGRSGSGKTSLLHLIAKSLDHLGNVKHKFSSGECNESTKNHHFLHCKQCKTNVDDQVLSMFLSESNKVRHIAMLPIEVYFNDKTTIKRSIDPLNRYSNDNIISSLNICGVSSFLIEKLLDLKYKNNGNIANDDTPLMSSDCSKLLSICLEKTIGELSLPMQVQRMLLFTHFFLKRSEINVLLIDEPPVIYRNHEQNPSIQSLQKNSHKKSSSLIPSIIFKYFSHSITFIVAHDIRNLNGIKEFWYLHQGNLTIKKL